MAVPQANNRTIVPTDAIQSREPSTIQQSVMHEELVRKIQAEEARKKAREEYRKANILNPRILAMSDEDIDNILERQQIAKQTVPQLSQDKRTKQEQKKSEKAFEEKVKQKELQDRLDEADAVMSVSTDYIPIIGSLLRGGQYNYVRDHLGWDYANNRYGWSPIISGTLDLATIPFGVGVKSLASSYAGGMAGRYVGDKYFDNPHVGQFIGMLIGHPTYNIASRTASKANNAYRGFQLERTLDKAVDNTQLINVPVEHVSPNGVTKGSTLDVGEGGIHLSPVGSSTIPQIENYLLSQGQFPFVRTGTWTFSNNTKPVKVQDVGYFGKGFNPDFDTKVNNGITNFSYTNNFEGKGNTSYLTTEPSQGLQLSKNTTNNASRIDWNTPDVITPEGIRLADGTLIKDRSGLNDLEKYFNPREIFYDDIIEDGARIGKKVTYLQNGRKYSVSTYPGEYYVQTPEGTQSFPFPNDGNTLDILNGRREALRHARQFVLDSRDKWIQSLDNVSQDIVRSRLISPESIPDKYGDRDLTLLINNSRIGNRIKASVQQDINDVYLSNEYITRYMKSLGLNPNNREFRDQITRRIANDLQETYETNDPIFYQYHSREGGISNSGNRTYGINGNADYRYFDNDWTSVTFHEFGHNLYGQNTPTGKYISLYTRNLLKNNPVEYSLKTQLAREVNPNIRKYTDYLSDPDEFRQRIMEGVRYGIKENLTPEEIYNQCNVQGFLDLKKHFTKQYLVKMLGLMLGTFPVIFKNNDKTS